MKRNRWALAVAMVFPSVMAWLYFVILGNHGDAATPATRNPVVVAAYGGAKIIQFAFPLLWVLVAERRRLRFMAPSANGLFLGVSFGLIVGGAILAVYYLFARSGQIIPLDGPSARLRAKVVEFGINTPVTYLGFCVFLAGLHSFLEEYYWRWFVFAGLRDWLPLNGAIALSSVAFMAHHIIDLAVFLPGYFWPVVMPMSAGVAIGGACWAWLFARSGSLYPPWISHVLVDAAIMAVGYDLIFRTVLVG